MKTKMLAFGASLVSMLGLVVGCTTEVDPEVTEPTGATDDALAAVECNPRNPQRTCDRGERCVELSVRDRDGSPYFCSAGRCDSVRDCGPGYACRLSQCIALERSRPWREAPPRHARRAAAEREERAEDGLRDEARDERGR